MRPAVFVDRDGTLLEEAGYLDRLERLAFFPFAIDAVRLLNQASYAVVIVTNQSGIARGMYAEPFVRETHAVMRTRMEEGGARVDGFYYCPHHPDATVAEFKRDCDCRKPAPGMLTAAARDLDLDLSRSFSIGDKWTDVAVGTAAGARGILVRTGYGRSTKASLPRDVTPASVQDNLIAAVAWILRHS
jgi:D-glycero-D-manno-heptose 1,7-bisphosphate phosphatase